MNEGFVTLPWYPPESLIKGIFINEQGQRFINEDCYHGRTAQMILQQRGTRYYVLADQETYGEPEFGEFAKIRIGAAGTTWQEIEKTLSRRAGEVTETVEMSKRNAPNAH